MGFMQICSLYDLKYTWHFIFLILNTIAVSYLDLGLPWGSFHLRYNKIYAYYSSHPLVLAKFASQNLLAKRVLDTAHHCHLLV